MNLHLFGATTTAGHALLQLALSSNKYASVFSYSRKKFLDNDESNYADFLQPDSFSPAGQSGSPAVLVSFAPIWLLAPFLSRLIARHPWWFLELRGVIACSSSSAITKRFSTNISDRELVAKLTAHEDELISTCQRFSVPCLILRPTLIYGKVGVYKDSNLSRLIKLMRLLPVLPVPADTGTRQPIHASQLAAVALHFAQQLAENGCNSSLPSRLAVGGDTTLSYFDMLKALQMAHESGDPVRRCRLLLVPNRLYFLLAAVLLIRSLKAFEAVLRIGSNLSGFTTVSQVLGSESQQFPLRPLT